MFMLYIYGTVFNNASIVESSLKSLDKIKCRKKFLIVDNFSTDNTYEILIRLKNIYDIEIRRVKCSRGMGRQLAMEMAYNESDDMDIFMQVDLDTIYNDKFISLFNSFLINIDDNSVAFNFICRKRVNFSVPWRDLNYGEDFERMARFLKNGYIVYKVPEYNKIANNQHAIKRERRYASGLKYLKRILHNNIDLIRGYGVSNYKLFKKFFKSAGFKKRSYIFVFLIYLFVKISGLKIYNYGDFLNNEYVNSNSLNICSYFNFKL
ncbi:hypothetical protein TZ01_01985 [Acidiplasma sp. MBA-1]|jgi:hypothetical protein|uniref:Glycosyltransferase 2-like domain-containing protein n=2 Tax=Ferroplasmaceae TaxID=90142 RepID=A0A0Q0VVF3_9ARCH|nr:hypothetical protein TZ01_01985 [Acidiplasma sp. MBA-1]KQB35617.1 hypothetical protein AOG55_06240 [Acidiplasma cupricumulans]